MVWSVKSSPSSDAARIRSLSAELVKALVLLGVEGTKSRGMGDSSPSFLQRYSACGAAIGINGREYVEPLPNDKVPAGMFSPAGLSRLAPPNAVRLRAKGTVVVT